MSLSLSLIQWSQENQRCPTSFWSPYFSQAGALGTCRISRILCPLWESVVTDFRLTSSKFLFTNESSTYTPHFITLSSDSLATDFWQHALPTLTAKNKMSWMLGLGCCWEWQARHSLQCTYAGGLFGGKMILFLSKKTSPSLLSQRWILTGGNS